MGLTFKTLILHQLSLMPFIKLQLWFQLWFNPDIITVPFAIYLIEVDTAMCSQLHTLNQKTVPLH